MDNREYTKALKNYPMALNVKEVSEILRISTKLVYRLINNGTILSVKIGRENNKSGCHAQLWQPHRKETKMAQKNLVAASLQAKKGRLYAVIQRKCPDGKFKSVWRALGLTEDAPKSKVNKVFREVVANYETEAEV